MTAEHSKLGRPPIARDVPGLPKVSNPSYLTSLGAVLVIRLPGCEDSLQRIAEQVGAVTVQA